MKSPSPSHPAPRGWWGRLTGRERGLILVLLVVSASLATYTWIHTPLLAQRQALLRQLAAHGETASTGPAKEQTSLAEREAKVNARLRGRDGMALFLAQVGEAEQRSGVTVKEVSARAPVTTGGAPVLTLTLQLTGTFDRVLRFAEQLDAITLVHRTNAFTLTANTGPESGVTASYQLSLYTAPDGSPPAPSLAAPTGRPDPFAPGK